jgi:formamidopyrimidine-DNA glycosylase
MPELPEVETVRRTLDQLAAGRTITGVEIGTFAGVIGERSASEFSGSVVGRQITGIERRAKYLFLMLDDGCAIMVHLRMTGQLVIASASDPALRFEHLRLDLDDGRQIRFADQRKFGRVLHLFPAEIAAIDRRLGPEPLGPDFTAEALRQRLASRTGRLKGALLDQSAIAGLGNIYVDEALFRARLHPERTPRGLTTTELRRLHRAIRSTLRDALANRGTTFSNYRDATGATGENQHALNVYGRGTRGEPCPRCGRPLHRIVVAGRGTHLCPWCQPERISTAPPAGASGHRRCR